MKLYQLLLLSVLALSCRCESVDNEGHEIVDEEPNGPIDFSEAEEQPDGSLCVFKTQYIEKLEKEQIKECWHDNVTQCHETYVTEFRPQQEQLCEENFWKACKITFRETNYNYTVTQCMTPLVRKCDPPKGYGAPPPKEVCRTWFESQCNTTYTEPEGEDEEPKPQTWCEKIPKKICAPDNCRMEPGEEVCHDKTLESTVQKPEEVCDLQPSRQCRLVTNLVPHLESQEICKEIPKEICTLRLDTPKVVKKPVKLKWCRKPADDEEEGEEDAAPHAYLPPPPPSYPPVYNEPQQAAYEPAQPAYGAPPAPAAPAATPSPVYYKPVSPASAPQHPQFRRIRL